MRSKLGRIELEIKTFEEEVGVQNLLIESEKERLKQCGHFRRMDRTGIQRGIS
jgi:hypothetical protein